VQWIERDAAAEMALPKKRDLSGAIGHNLPQEASQRFAQAVVDVGSSS
jgi:hypothetical protein